MITKFVYKIADLSSRVSAYILLTGGVIAAIVIGLLFNLGAWYWTALNLSISVITMSNGQAVLVSARRDGLAIHLKLDKAVEAADTDNVAIGMEHKEERDIQAELDKVERGKD